MQSKQGNPLNRIKNRITSGPKPDLDTIIYHISKELGCLGDLIGREYEVTGYDKEGRVKSFRQKPIKTVKLLKLIDKAKEDAERQTKEMKKPKKKR